MQSNAECAKMSSIAITTVGSPSVTVLRQVDIGDVLVVGISLKTLLHMHLTMYGVLLDQQTQCWAP